MKYNGKTDISFDQIKEMASAGIVGVVKKGKIGRFSFAHDRGMYLGSPGKEIFFSLPSLSDDQMSLVVSALASHYPLKPPGNHVKWAACIRYIYGCFEKQGCLRSKADKKRMVQEDVDWNLPNKFMSLLKDEFERRGCKYGLILWHEMYAHRIGDRAIIENDPSKLDEMLFNYERSQKLALATKSWKHTFSPYYWAASYFYEIGDADNCIKFHKKSLSMMNKYCPDAREGYREKAKTSLKHLKHTMNNAEWKKWYNGFRKKATNKCLRKVVA